MPKAEQSPLYELAGIKLKRDPAEWLNDQHAQGKSWDEIALAVYGIMNRRITAQTLRTWAKNGTG